MSFPHGGKYKFPKCQQILFVELLVKQMFLGCQQIYFAEMQAIITFWNASNLKFPSAINYVFHPGRTKSEILAIIISRITSNYTFRNACDYNIPDASSYYFWKCQQVQSDEVLIIILLRNASDYTFPKRLQLYFIKMPALIRNTVACNSPIKLSNVSNYICSKYQHC